MRWRRRELVERGAGPGGAERGEEECRGGEQVEKGAEETGVERGGQEGGGSE